MLILVELGVLVEGRRLLALHLGFAFGGGRILLPQALLYLLVQRLLLLLQLNLLLLVEKLLPCLSELLALELCLVVAAAVGTPFISLDSLILYRIVLHLAASIVHIVIF